MKRKVFCLSLLVLTCSFLKSQPVERFIIVDQFGYLPVSEKTALIKNPVTGFDAVRSFTPGENYVLVNAATGARIFRGQPLKWKSGATDASSGDQVWHFDFSTVTDTGSYYILDSVNQVRSYEFRIAPGIYNEVLRQAVRSFFYQRAGCAKEAKYAGEAWADGASHIGPLQDKNCRPYNEKTNASKERDLSGGWYDAGDYNKYTNWTASYIVEMMKSYIENPAAWGDNYNLPESGNGIPDLLDEARWGIDFLLRMQQDDGGVLSIVSESHASPPSSATGQSVYGPASSSATWNTAAALAISAKVFRSVNRISYSDSLISAAEKAWDWAEAHPAVIFHNNSASNGSSGVGAGDQETSDYGRFIARLKASCFLYEVTGKESYHSYFSKNYQNVHLIQWNYAYPYEPSEQDLLLYYSTLSKASPAISNQVKTAYRNAMLTNGDNFPAWYSSTDPYKAHMDSYTWGSNNQKGAVGSMFYNMIQYNIDPLKNQDALNAAAAYIHYIHGVNPLNLVYLSNMYAFGGDSCVNEFYHSWFTNGSPKWDRVGTSLYGPAPGFLTGGPNPSYNWDGCCNTPNCGSAGNNAICISESISPPKDQPKQKSYKDFNTSWPLNSWEVTENSCGYQVSYIRLLSKFVTGFDCHGDSAGTADFDLCGICSGGNTGREPATENCECHDYGKTAHIEASACESMTSPSGKYMWTVSGIYNDTLTAADGCDSILVVTLKVNHPTGNTITVNSCSTYTSPAGSRYSVSGTYYDTIPNAAGCDSIITINLTIPVINTLIAASGDTLVAEEKGLDYHWLNCDNDYEQIEGATGESFLPGVSGNYAVEISYTGCKDTSQCYYLEITGIRYNEMGPGLIVYPNPAREVINIKLPESCNEVYVEIRNISGALMFSEKYLHSASLHIPLKLPPGFYMVMLKNNLDQKAIVKIGIE
ncbi:MAG TPA: glycoside hydrolase family 9 protein [Bacteroidales bacterium]|nr:glycoside hydrolase family 9 protein [Bacteroidales bacterium]